jgi:PAS domain S-box-containing protein
MVLFDTRTIIFSSVVTDILCVLVILLLWHQSRKRFSGTGFWVLDFAFQTAAVFLIAMRGGIPNWMSMVLSNTLVIAGAILGYMGLGRFIEKKISQGHNYVLLAAFFCVHAYLTFVQPNLAARTLNLSAVLLIICFQCMWLLVYRAEQGMRRLTLAVGMVFGAYCLVSIVRIVGFFTVTRSTNDLFKSGSFESLILISYQILFILLTYSLVLMVNKRLLLKIRQAEEESRLLIKYAPSMFYEIDFHRPAFKSVNDTMCEFLGYTREELLAMNPFDLLDDDGKALFRERIRRKLAGETISDSVEYKSKTKDGREVYGILNITFTYKDGNPEGAVVIAHDITERKRAEQRIERLTKLYSVLSRVNETIVRTHNEGPLYAEICRIVAEEGGFPLVWVGQIKGKQVTPEAFYGPASNYLKEIRVEVEGELGSGPTGTCIRENRSVINDDFDTNPSAAPWRKPAMTYGFRASAAFPLRRQGSVMGALTLYAPEPGTFDTEHVKLLESLCADISYALDAIQQEKLRSEAEENLRDRTLELQRLTETLEMRVQERTEELQVINEELKTENEERLRVEIELRESENRLRELSTALLSAQERERKVIAGEIHDSMGASLAAAKFKIESAFKEMDDCNPQARATLENVVPILQRTMEESRRIQMSLRPSILDDLGILATIKWFCRQFESTYSRISIKQEIDIQDHEVPESLKIVIYRILQEGLNNVAKHSKASVVFLKLRRAGNAIQLTIRDSGQGFDLEEAHSRKGTAKGLGLDSMRERAELSGGSFLIESSKGAGTVIRAIWPLRS